MEKIFPQKLKPGDQIRVIAPAQSLAIISEQVREVANHRLRGMGLTVTYAKHANEIDDFRSSSIASRVEDLHEAFRDPAVKGVFSAIGGFNSNQLLKYIDWDLIRNNPKVFCGYSDITTLSNAILHKTGLVTYSGPHYSTFGQELHFEYTLDYFRQCIMSSDPFDVYSARSWSDDMWYKNQQDRNLIANAGWLAVNEGSVEGKVVGGNLGTLNLLQGTGFFPSMRGRILFLEDDLESLPQHVDRNLQSLIHLTDFREIKALVIGRFQKRSQMTDDIIRKIIHNKRELDGIPVLANVDFGHTDPKITLPIGGTCQLGVSSRGSSLRIIKH